MLCWTVFQLDGTAGNEEHITLLTMIIIVLWCHTLWMRQEKTPTREQANPCSKSCYDDTNFSAAIP